MESIRSVNMQVIKKIWRPCSGSPVCLITSVITDQLGQHEVLLPILITKFKKEIVRKPSGEGTDNSFHCRICKKKNSSSVTDPLEHMHACSDAYCPIT